MAETAPSYFAVLTDAGAELEARAIAEKKAIILTHITVGDANLNVVTPTVKVTKLVHEVYRCPIDSLSRDENDKKIALLHGTIPANIGGFWINELGVVGHLDGEEKPNQEVLYAYANHARYYKVLPQQGQSLVHTIVVPIVQCTNAKVILNIQDDGYATVDQLRALLGYVRWFANGTYEIISTWTISTGIANNGTLTLPSPAKYIVGTDVIDLYWNGLTLFKDLQYKEVASGNNQLSNQFKLLFKANAQDEFQIRIRHLGGIGEQPNDLPIIADTSEGTNYVRVFEDELNS